MYPQFTIPTAPRNPSLVVLLVCSLGLGACGGGGGGGGASSAGEALNRAPVISGSPSSTIEVGSSYTFTPSASDPDGDSLTFSVSNAPSFATFSASDGSLVVRPQDGDEGSYPNISISVSDGQLSASLPAFDLAVTERASSNRAPVIGGTPATQVVAGSAYTFRPAASDADGDSLTFSITNAPPWAGFDAANGTLSGTPQQADVGTWAGIEISVSDGEATASLPAFAIDVVAATGATGSAELSWTAPTLNTDGSTLDDLAGYKIFYGPSTGNYTNQIQLNDPEATTYTVDGLPAGTWYFAVKAISLTGSESAYTDEVSKLVGGN